jgi:cysteine desulfurase
VAPDDIYLDHNATTPLLPEVVEAMVRVYRAGPANPASQHRPGRRARQAIEDAREAIGRLLGANVDGRASDQVVFTSGGTEANNLALAGLGADRSGGIVISAVEHPSVMGPALRLQQQGVSVSRLPVNADGQVLLDALAEQLQSSPRLVSVMLGNNETGVLQPIAKIAALCRESGVLLHTDAVQAVGKQPLDFRALGVDALSLSAHKFHGPVGIGALIVRHGVTLEPQLRGGFQQAGLRPGTEAVALAIGMRTALEAWQRESREREERLRTLRDRLEQRLLGACPELVVHGRGTPRLPQTSNIAFGGVNRQALLMALDLAGVACSTGSACASGSSEPSPVLLAMGCSKDLVEASLRFSLGATTTTVEVDQAAERILQIYKDLRDKIPGRKMASPGRGGAPISL